MITHIKRKYSYMVVILNTSNSLTKVRMTHESKQVFQLGPYSVDNKMNNLSFNFTAINSIYESHLKTFI